MLLAMNLQQSLAAGPRIRLELAGVPELYTEISVRSFDTFFLWRGQLDAQSIQDDVCSWLMLVKDCARTRRRERKPCLAWDTAPKKRAATAPM